MTTTRQLQTKADRLRMGDVILLDDVAVEVRVIWPRKTSGRDIHLVNGWSFYAADDAPIMIERFATAIDSDFEGL